MNMKEIKNNVQVEDDQIILGEPLKILKYGKVFKIEQIKWIEWDRYVNLLSTFLHYYYVVCGFSKLPDNLNDLKEFRDNIRTTMSNKKIVKVLFKMMKLSKWNTRFIRKKFTPDDIAELFCYSYAYNVLGVKKNFRDVLKGMQLMV
jgi:hypothetical protein